MGKIIAIDINDVLRDYTGQFVNTYIKNINPSFEIDNEKINDFDFFNVFPFVDENGNPSRDLYNKFKYEDCAFELYGSAQTTDKNLISNYRLWTQNTMQNFDEEKVPEIILFSPFEMNLSIQSTLSFLARIGIRNREIYFPVDSYKMWEKCDIMITANPNLIKETPEGKVSIKINKSYNKDVEGTYNFDSMTDIINDDNKILIKLIEDD